MSTLYVSRAWNSQPVQWDCARTTAFAGLDAKLIGRHFDVIVICMAEIDTVQSVLPFARLRLKPHGQIVLDYADPVDFFRRRGAR